MTTTYYLHRGQRRLLVTVWKHDPSGTAMEECEKCEPATLEDMERERAMAALTELTVIEAGCGHNCTRCIQEEKGSLWLTTDEPPMPLEELFDIIQGSG